MLENDQGPVSRHETDEPFERQRWQKEPRVAHHYPSLRPNGWYKVIAWTLRHWNRGRAQVAHGSR